MLWNSDFSNLGVGGGDENWFEKSWVKLQCSNERRENDFWFKLSWVSNYQGLFKSGTYILANQNTQADY